MILYEGKCLKGAVFMKDGTTEILVPDAKILGAGKATESSGIIIADQNRFWYVPLLTPNISSIIDEMITICDKISSTTEILEKSKTLLDNTTAVTGAASIVPSIVTGTEMSTNASSLKNEIKTVKQELNTLKENLI